MNIHGDFRHTPNTTPRFTAPGNVPSIGGHAPSNNLPPLSMAELNTLSDRFESKGATLLFSFAPEGAGVAFDRDNPGEVNLANSVRYKEHCETYFTFEVISHPVAYWFNHSDMYDSNAHLNINGVAKRTAQLIEDLKASRWYAELAEARQ
jgi:hypothetical protein